MVEGTCLENKQSESSRGFESYFLRQTLRKGRHGAALAVDAAKGPGTPSCRFRSGSPPRGALALSARQSGVPGPFSLTLACSSAQPRLLRGRPSRRAGGSLRERWPALRCLAPNPSRRGAVAFGKACPFTALPREPRPSLPYPEGPSRRAAVCLRQNAALHRLAWRGPCRRGGCDWMGATRRWVGARGTE